MQRPLSPISLTVLSTIAVVSSEAKEAVARAAGAREVVRSDGPWKDRVLELTGGRGVELVFDPVGGDRVLDTMRCLAPSGRWLVIGFVGGAIPEIALNPAPTRGAIELAIEVNFTSRLVLAWMATW